MGTNVSSEVLFGIAIFVVIIIIIIIIVIIL